MMKNPSLHKYTAQLSHTTLLGAVVFFLAGCGQEPNPAPVAKPSDALPTVEDAASARKASEPAQPVAKEKTRHAEVDVAVFLEDALNGKTESVRQAIEAGVDVNSVDEELRTALLFASFNGHTAVVKLLLESGALLGRRDSLGRTALMFAATGDNAETVELLLEKGAEVNAFDANEGFTALMHAAAEGHADVVKVLLQYDADPTMRDTDGDSARDFAERNRHADVVQLLAK
ncbi:MAG: ankyrin repeat domain-containing protein [Bythopirellula sp.]